MVKPAGAYRISCATFANAPNCRWAPTVSGEYAMIKFAAQAGAIDEEKVILESPGRSNVRARI